MGRHALLDPRGEGTEMGDMPSWDQGEEGPEMGDIPSWVPGEEALRWGACLPGTV